MDKAGKEVDSIKSLLADESVSQMQKDKVHTLDAWKESEFKSRYIENVESLPLDYINENITRIDANHLTMCFVPVVIVP
jgi:hypothetical protein